MKKKILFILPVFVLMSCGLDAQLCQDDLADFPNYTETNFTIRNNYNYVVANPSSDGKLITNYKDMSLEQRTRKEGNEIIEMSEIEYAYYTQLSTTAQLPQTVRYPKLFDGEISCAGANANSRLGLYSSGVIIDLKRNLQSSNGLVLYMSSSYLVMKLNATVTLYKQIGSKKQYDAYNFTFRVDLTPTLLGPNFFYFDFDKILGDASELNDTKMIGFKYQRLALTEEEIESERYVEYLSTQAQEEELKSFVKMYDIAFPYSKWN